MRDNKKSNNKKLLNTSLDAFDERLRKLEEKVSHIKGMLETGVTRKDLQDLRDDMSSDVRLWGWFMIGAMTCFAFVIIIALASSA